MVRYRTDWILFMTTLILVVLGIAIVYSASSANVVAKQTARSDQSPGELTWWKPVGAALVWKQIAAAVLGFLALMILKRIDYRTLNDVRWAFLPLGLILPGLIIAYLFGRKHRWISCGVADLQPSEFAKPALIVFLAWFVVRRLRHINNLQTLKPAALAIAVVGVLVLAADFGTAVVLLGTAAAVFFVAGLDKRYFLFAGVAVCLVLVASLFHKPYCLKRLIARLDPEYKIVMTVNPSGQLRDWLESVSVVADPNYQAHQSVIAVGSGGVFGLGLGEGKQKVLYLPEAHTDFIFAVVGEEMGLWGTTAILAAFIIILWRGLRLFWAAPDDFGKYLALGLTVCLVLQAFVNMSVVLDLGPTKGIPLPLISYGGSSMLSSLVALGMLLSVSENAG